MLMENTKVMINENELGKVNGGEVTFMSQVVDPNGYKVGEEVNFTYLGHNYVGVIDDVYFSESEYVGQPLYKIVYVNECSHGEWPKSHSTAIWLYNSKISR